MGKARAQKQGRKRRGAKEGAQKKGQMKNPPGRFLAPGGEKWIMPLEPLFFWALPSRLSAGSTGGPRHLRWR